MSNVESTCLLTLSTRKSVLSFYCQQAFFFFFFLFSLLLTSCRRSRWNWSPISWSFCAMQASVLRAAGCCRGSRSIPPRSASLSCRLASRSPASSKRAGKCNRKPALPVECQSWYLISRKQRVQWKKKTKHRTETWQTSLYFRYQDFFFPSAE